MTIERLASLIGDILYIFKQTGAFSTVKRELFEGCKSFFQLNLAKQGFFRGSFFVFRGFPLQHQPKKPANKNLVECFTHLAVLDPEKKFERLIFPAKYGIPKTLKPVSHGLSKFNP